jgi:heat shock protein HslJ
MKRPLSIVWIIPLLTCTMCASFPIILNLGAVPTSVKAPYNVQGTDGVQIVNWGDDPSTQIKQDPDVQPQEEVWRLEAMNNEVVAEWAPVFRFNATQTEIEGRSFCNDFYATCVLDSTAFSINTIDNTWQYCEGEQEFYVTLVSATRCVTENNRLYFFDGEKVVLQFVKEPSNFRPVRPNGGAHRTQ